MQTTRIPNGEQSLSPPSLRLVLALDPPRSPLLHLLTNPDLTTPPTAPATSSTIAIYLEVDVEVNQEMGMETHLYKAMDVKLGTSPSSTTVLTSMTGLATTASMQRSTKK
jgi:hypothetical protein